MTRPAYHRAAHVDATKRTSRWSRLLWKQRAEQDPLASAAIREVESAFLLRAPAALKQDIEVQRQRDLSKVFAAEVFADLYEKAEAIEAPAAGTDLVVKAHEILSNLPEADALRAQVHGDPDMAAMATVKLLNGAVNGIRAYTEEERKAKRAEAKAAASGRRQRGPKADPEGALRRAMRQAVAGAAKAAVEGKMLLNGLKPGLGEAPPLHEQDGSDRFKLARTVTADPRLKRVMAMAGRLRRESAAARTDRDREGASVLVGVTIGGDIARALPTELGLLRHPRLRRVQLAKLADRRLQQYDLQGDTPKGRGPIVLLVDQSGSMKKQERNLWAAAISIACLGIAQKEGRECTVIGFASSIKEILRLDADGVAWAHNPRELKSAERIGDVSTIALKVATSTPYGGTDFDDPIQAAMDLEEGVLKERADFILVTDGRANVSHHILGRLNRAKEETELNCIGLTIGGGSLGHAVRQICDRTVNLDKAIADDDGKGVGGALP